jgi:hypothetical protein
MPPLSRPESQNLPCLAGDAAWPATPGRRKAVCRSRQPKREALAVRRSVQKPTDKDALAPKVDGRSVMRRAHTRTPPLAQRRLSPRTARIIPPDACRVSLVRQVENAARGLQLLSLDFLVLDEWIQFRRLFGQRREF